MFGANDPLVSRLFPGAHPLPAKSQLRLDHEFVTAYDDAMLQNIRRSTRRTTGHKPNHIPGDRQSPCRSTHRTAGRKPNHIAARKPRRSSRRSSRRTAGLKPNHISGSSGCGGLDFARLGGACPPTAAAPRASTPSSSGGSGFDFARLGGAFPPTAAAPRASTPNSSGGNGFDFARLGGASPPTAAAPRASASTAKPTHATCRTPPSNHGAPPIEGTPKNPSP